MVGIYYRKLCVRKEGKIKKKSNGRNSPYLEGQLRELVDKPEVYRQLLLLRIKSGGKLEPQFEENFRGLSVLHLAELFRWVRIHPITRRQMARVLDGKRDS